MVYYKVCICSSVNDPMICSETFIQILSGLPVFYAIAGYRQCITNE